MEFSLSIFDYTFTNYGSLPLEIISKKEESHLNSIVALRELLSRSLRASCFRSSDIRQAAERNLPQQNYQQLTPFQKIQYKPHGRELRHKYGRGHFPFPLPRNY
jgi:hypothetical protein